MENRALQLEVNEVTNQAEHLKKTIIDQYQNFNAVDKDQGFESETQSDKVEATDQHGSLQEEIETMEGLKSKEQI